MKKSHSKDGLYKNLIILWLTALLGVIGYGYINYAKILGGAWYDGAMYAAGFLSCVLLLIKYSLLYKKNLKEL